jgi:hypothetical protein
MCHLSSARCYGDGINLRDRWIASVVAKGGEPIIKVIETTTSEKVQERETYWIAEYLAMGYPLTNGVMLPKIGT